MTCMTGQQTPAQQNYSLYTHQCWQCATSVRPQRSVFHVQMFHRGCPESDVGAYLAKDRGVDREPASPLKMPLGRIGLHRFGIK